MNFCEGEDIHSLILNEELQIFKNVKNTTPGITEEKHSDNENKYKHFNKTRTPCFE